MPHSTYGYPFEEKVFGYASQLSERLTGRELTFLMTLDFEGVIRALQFEPPKSSWHELTDRLTKADEAYLFYDPFDAPEYTWISWLSIKRSTMERLIGSPFDEIDFGKHSHAVSAAPELAPANEFPVSWGVMF